MPFRPASTLPGDLDMVELTLTEDELLRPGALTSLVDAVRTVPDPRAKHLVVHPLPILLGLAACAKLCGATPCAPLSAGPGDRAPACSPRWRSPTAPPAATVTRAFTDLDGDVFDDALGRFVQHQAADPPTDAADPPPFASWLSTASECAAPRTTTGVNRTYWRPI